MTYTGVLHRNSDGRLDTRENKRSGGHSTDGDSVNVGRVRQAQSDGRSCTNVDHLNPGQRSRSHRGDESDIESVVARAAIESVEAVQRLRIGGGQRRVEGVVARAADEGVRTSSERTGF